MSSFGLTSYPLGTKDKTINGCMNTTNDFILHYCQKSLDVSTLNKCPYSSLLLERENFPKNLCFECHQFRSLIMFGQ